MQTTCPVMTSEGCFRHFLPENSPTDLERYSGDLGCSNNRLSRSWLASSCTLHFSKLFVSRYI